MRIHLFALLVGFLSSVPLARATEPCESHLLPTSELVPYLETLLEQRVLSTEDLSLFAANLDQGLLLNPIPASAGSAAVIHRQALNRLLALPVDRAALTRWTRESLSRRLQTQTQREHTRDSTTPFFREPRFVRIPGGQVIDRVGRGYTVADFEISDILVTQGQWRREMDQMPTVSAVSRVSDDERGPDHPVTEVTWWSAVEFANRLSRKAGLRPAYNLANVNWRAHTSAEAGTWATADDSFEPVGQVISSASNRDANDLEGYRLLNYPELLLMLQRYLWTTPDIVAHLKSYFWIRTELLQPVATTPKSLQIEGTPLHDFLGTVRPFMHGWYGPNSFHTYTAQSAGLSRLQVFNDLKDLCAYPTRANAGVDDIGIRIVRTLP